MKKRNALALLLAVLLLISASACTPGAKNGTAAELSCLAFKTEGGSRISAYRLSADFDAGALSLDENSLYSVEKPDDNMYLLAYPKYFSGDNLVLQLDPLASSAKNCKIYSEDTLYYEDYTLVTDETAREAVLFDGGGSALCGIPLLHGDLPLTPRCFYVKDKELVLLGMTDVGINDTEIVTQIYSGIDAQPSLTASYEYAGIWEEYDLSKVFSPLYELDSLAANAQKDKFLYNERGHLIEISPRTGEISVILDVKAINRDMPQLDTFREFYSFFYKAAYMGEYLVSAFRNYNGIDGIQMVVYKDGEFVGNLLCTAGQITMFSSDGAEAATISDENIMPNLFGI